MSDTSFSIPSTPPAAADAGGSTSPAFMDFVPAELKDSSWVQDLAKNDEPFKAFFNQHDHAQKKIGEKSSGVVIPGEGASEEVVNNFRKARGVPESADGYEYAMPDVSKEPEAVQNYLKELAKDEGLLKAMKAEAHKLGITPGEFKALTSVFDNFQVEQARAMIESATAANQLQADDQMKKFKEHYGDKAEAVQKIAKEMAEKVLPQAIRDMKDPDIALFEALRYIHENVFSNDSVQNAGTTTSGALTKVEVELQLKSIRNNPDFKNKFAPGYEDLQKRANELYEQLVAKDE